MFRSTSPSRPCQLADPAPSLRIRELLRSNSQPPDNLQSTISALSEELARYDGALREELAGLEATRAVLRVYYDDCGALLAPIRRLPSELLVKIFGLLSSEKNESRAAFPVTSLNEAMFRLSQDHLLVLSRICSWFHTLVMNTSTLWDTIHLDILWTTPADTKKIMFVLRRILERGGN
ncbi:hypothetical protein B0H17DRAFT_1196292 [Mycena rosella]|uniref:F-box domain-containing protein n=1 Tax=Mycena rosella TaxID=1033263 RepID=A0AAD7GKE1_MYCRO|nr:hypothetical protein B0H17DRAFT_1196292 [Mycena rosella]